MKKSINTINNSISVKYFLLVFITIFSCIYSSNNFAAATAHEGQYIKITSKPSKDKLGVIRLYPFNDRYCLNCWISYQYSDDIRIIDGDSQRQLNPSVIESLDGSVIDAISYDQKTLSTIIIHSQQ